ncbi:lymphocyte-specific protein 1-like [Solea solea]|uniref:lymphocyte-specific protein 1-like n=1 Tax=Solea solea TaxID=90069 RepID=UPI00272ACAD5|nr:lymphocyte-specific protein 1-like [Solea solea]
MSESIRRRSSSRQLLQNLISLTAQRSQEDAEEVERERRRRAREKEREEGSPSCAVATHHDNLTHSVASDCDLKPSYSLVLEEDEGFGDWSHRLENRNEQEVMKQPPLAPQLIPGSKEEKQQEDAEEAQEPERSNGSHEASTMAVEKMSESKKEIKTSFSSSVFLPQDIRLQQTSGHKADRASYLAAGTMSGWACRVDGEEEQGEQEEREEEAVQPTLETEWSAETSHYHSVDDPAEEQQIFTHEQREELHHMGQQRRREGEEEGGEEGEHNKPDKGSVERTERKSEEVDGSSAISLCSSDGEEALNCYGPMSPTFKKLLIQFYPDEINTRVSPDGKCMIIERAESLKRSANIKKTLPTVTVSKIDKKLEQYTHAIELSSKEGRMGGQALTDVISPPEPVASKKNLFEAGEAWNQTSISVAASKEIKSGGVLNKKNLWESLGDILSPGRDGKESSPGKGYKFMVTGHGKYEKVDSSSIKDASCQSATEFYEDL